MCVGTFQTCVNLLRLTVQYNESKLRRRCLVQFRCTKRDHVWSGRTVWDRDARSQKVGVWCEAARPVIFSLRFNVNKTKLDGRFAKLERYFVGSMPFFIIDRVTSLRTDPPTYSECFLFRPRFWKHRHNSSNMSNPPLSTRFLVQTCPRVK